MEAMAAMEAMLAAILRRPCLMLLFVMLSAGFAAAPSAAWTPESHRVIAASAARLAPPDLYRQIARNRESFFIGVTEPFQNSARINHVKNPDGSGHLDEAIRIAVDNAILSIQAMRPFNEVAYRLGVVAHYIADANNPLATAETDRHEARYTDDFLRYLESTEPRLRTTFYGFRSGFDDPRDVAKLLDEALRRGRQLYPQVGREYQRIGYRPGVGTFSDRSTAFAVASLSYSHALSDIADMLRYIWLAGGGADARRRIPLRGSQVVVFPLDQSVR